MSINYKEIQKYGRKMYAAVSDSPLNQTADEYFEDIEKGIKGVGEGDNFKYLDKDYEIMLKNVFKLSIQLIKELRKETKQLEKRLKKYEPVY